MSTGNTGSTAPSHDASCLLSFPSLRACRSLIVGFTGSTGSSGEQLGPTGRTELNGLVIINGTLLINPPSGTTTASLFSPPPPPPPPAVTPVPVPAVVADEEESVLVLDAGFVVGDSEHAKIVPHGKTRQLGLFLERANRGVVIPPSTPFVTTTLSAIDTPRFPAAGMVLHYRGNSVFPAYFAINNASHIPFGQAGSVVVTSTQNLLPGDRLLLDHMFSTP